MTKEEYKKNYHFDYDDRALYYLMKNYKINLDVAKVYMKNIYAIEETKNYINSKLQFLSGG